MLPTDQAYLWSINPITGQDPSGNLGLGSLVPSPILNPSPQPTSLSGSLSSLPTPQFSKNAQDYFSNISNDVQEYNSPPYLFAEPSGADSYAPYTPETTKIPYFDPNYPVESLTALRDYLGPQVEAGVNQGLAARGLYSTGVGQYAQQNALNYLNTVAPAGINQAQAQVMDFARLYGPNIANSLTENTFHPGDSYFGDFYIPASLPLGTPIGNSSTPNMAKFFLNPSYSGDLTNYSSKSGVPEFGMYDFLTKENYLTPGYFYNPTQAPDTSLMPWLQNAKYPSTSSTG